MAATMVWRLTGGASNSDPNLALGGASSSNAISGTAMNNLFDDVTEIESAAGGTEYRALDVRNTGDATGVTVTVYMDPDTSSTGTQLDMGIEASPLGSTTSITNESTAPAGVTFANYLTGSRLSLPDIAAGAYCRVWFRRVVSAATTNTSNDSSTPKVSFA